MDPSYFPAISCMDFMDHEQDETLVPSDFTGSLCIARFQPLNPGSKTPTYFQDKSSDVDDDDLDGNEDEMEKDESEDAISDSSSSKNGHGNLSSKTDESSTNSSSRSFHLERNAMDHNVIEDQHGSDKGLRSKKTAKEQHCSKIQGRKFNKSNVFKLQFQVHNHERPYVCYICNRSFNQREHLEFHIDHHTKIKLCCEICGQRFVKAEQLTKHLQIHSGENTYKCQLCSQGFLDSSGLYSHLRSHYLVNPFSCAACKKTFARRQNLKSHLIKAHNLSEEMVTSILPQKRKSYEHQQNTSTAMISNKIHKMFVPRHLDSPTSSTNYKATDPCIDAVGYRSNLNSMGVNSAADSPHLFKADQARSLCVEINTFDKINELKAENSGDHKTIQISQFPSPIISENPRKFLVECAGDNVRNSDFSKISDSNGEEWINDEICSVSKDTDSISESDLESRIPLPKQPPYPCCYCERQFSRRSNLKVHVKIHLGVKPFPCPTCKKDFNRKSNLKVHMAKVHDCDKNAVIEHLKTYCINGENNAVAGTELDGIDSIDEAMSALIRDVADNEEHEKHDSLNGNILSAVPGCNFSVSYESQSNINQTNENIYLHNSDHYLPLYPTEDNPTYNTNSTADTFKKNIFLTANNNANLPPYDAQNTSQNEHSSELQMSLIKDEQIYKEFSLTFPSQMPSKVLENQNEITLDLKDSFTNDSVSKTYECKICGHKFSRRGNLMGHYKVHSGIRQFVCPICQKSFTRKSNLRVHLVKIHNMNVEKSAHLLELGRQTS